jgi:hypothetical protein
MCSVRGEQCAEQEAGRTQHRRLIVRQKRHAAARVWGPERRDPVMQAARGVHAPRAGLADEVRHQGGVGGCVDCCWPLGSKDRVEQTKPVRRQKHSPDQDRPEEASAERDEQRAGEEVGQMRRPRGSVVSLSAESLRRRGRALPRGLRSSPRRDDSSRGHAAPIVACPVGECAGRGEARRGRSGTNDDATRTILGRQVDREAPLAHTPGACGGRHRS